VVCPTSKLGELVVTLTDAGDPLPPVGFPPVDAPVHFWFDPP
jgi:hypothetical protein